MNESNNKYHKHCAEIIDEMQDRTNTQGSAQTPCFMATPNQTDEGWNKADLPTFA